MGIEMNIQNLGFNLFVINYLLVVTRLFAFFLFAPIFGSNAIPFLIKLYIVAIVSFLICQSATFAPVQSIPTFYDLSLLLLKEISVGAILTFVASLVYLPLRIVGTEIGNLGGFGQDHVFNVDDKSNFTVLEEFFNIIGILVIFTINGHHVLLKLITDTFNVIPLGKVCFDPKIVKITTIFFCKAFTQGIAITAPVMGAILISSASFGILSKSVPEMNLLVLDLPLRIFIGLGGLVFALPMIIRIFESFMGLMIKHLEGLVLAMSGGGI